MENHFVCDRASEKIIFQVGAGKVALDCIVGFVYFPVGVVVPFLQAGYNIYIFYFVHEEVSESTTEKQKQL